MPRRVRRCQASTAPLFSSAIPVTPPYPSPPAGADRPARALHAVPRILPPISPYLPLPPPPKFCENVPKATKRACECVRWSPRKCLKATSVSENTGLRLLWVSQTGHISLETGSHTPCVHAEDERKSDSVHHGFVKQGLGSIRRMKPARTCWPWGVGWLQNPLKSILSG